MITRELTPWDNLPDKYRRQHSEFAWTEQDRGATPIARQAYVLRAEIVQDLGHIDDDEMRLIHQYEHMRSAASANAKVKAMDPGRLNGKEIESEAPGSNVDKYYCLVFLLGIEHKTMLDILASPLNPDESYLATRIALNQLTGKIQTALKHLQEALDNGIEKLQSDRKHRALSLAQNLERLP